MSNSGFKFIIPVVVRFGGDLGGLVSSPLNHTAMEVLVNYCTDRDTFKLPKSETGNGLETKQLEGFSQWIKAQLNVNDNNFHYTFLSVNQTFSEAYFAAVLFSLYQLSKWGDKPEFSVLVNSSYIWLQENNIVINRLTYYTYLLGGTRFDPGDNLTVVRQSFPLGYSILRINGIIGNMEVTSLSQVDAQKLLSLYHGLFFSDWTYIKGGLMSDYRPEILSDVEIFLESVVGVYTFDIEGKLLVVFPNSLHASDFRDYLISSTLDNEQDVEIVMSTFSNEGIYIC